MKIPLYDALDQAEKAATPANEQTARLDRWIEWRSETEKYSIAEFEREADRDLYILIRTHLPKFLDLAKWAQLAYGLMRHMDCDGLTGELEVLLSALAIEVEVP